MYQPLRCSLHPDASRADGVEDQIFNRNFGSEFLKIVTRKLDIKPRLYRTVLITQSVKNCSFFNYFQLVALSLNFLQVQGLVL